MKKAGNNIFRIALIFSVVIFAIGLISPGALVTFLKQFNKSLLSAFSGWYLLFGFLIVLIAVILLIIPIGKVKLGNTKPEYRFYSWIALLYSTGMGSGLLLRAVQEPIYYYTHPPVESLSDKQNALTFTFFHWGFTPWAMYSLFGLIIAYNIYQTKEVNYLRAVFVDIKYKWISKGINLFIVLITIVGVIASLGLGAAQVLEGTNHIFGLQLNTPHLLLLVLSIGIISTLSAMTGIKKVIKILADFDLAISILLLLFVSLFLDFSPFLSNSLGAFKRYVFNFVDLSLSSGDFNTDKTFTNEWTVFYWAFWIAWVPFTGVFIARISKGRTLKEFLMATILIPALATLIWFSVFGNMAFQSIGSTYTGQYDNLYNSLFIFLDTLPFSEFTILATILLVFTAIINSVDSAIFVLSMFSDGGNENPHKIDKIKWGVLITITALGLTAVGTNDLLSAVSSLLIIMALPFSFLYVILIKNFLLKLFKRMN